jgi:hypothetical protein
MTPRYRHVVTARLYLANKKEIPALVCIEPAAVPIQGIFAARALSRLGAAASDTSQASPQPDQASTAVPANSVHIMLTNVSRKELTLPKAIVLWLAEEISEGIDGGINKEITVNTNL